MNASENSLDHFGDATVASTTDQTILSATGNPVATPTTPPTASTVPTAATTVFNLPELLTQILRQTDDPKTILRSEQINKTFRATLQASPGLQEALWLRPRPITSRTRKGKYINNRLLDRRWVRRKLGIQTWLQWDLDKYKKGIAPDTGRILIDFFFADWESLRTVPGGTWADMLVVQPTEMGREIVWCLGVWKRVEGSGAKGGVGKQERKLYKVHVGWPDGYLPRMRDLVCEVLITLGPGFGEDWGHLKLSRVMEQDGETGGDGAEDMARQADKAMAE